MKQNVYDYSYEMRIERKRLITKTFTVVVSIVLFLTLFLNFILFPAFVKSESMESDIAKNSAVFVTPLIRTPRRGDVVYLSRMDDYSVNGFKTVINKIVGFFTAQQIEPFGYTSSMTGKACVRRVLALPGDTIYMQDYVLYVKKDGESLYFSEYEIAAKPYNIHIYSVPVEWDGMGVSGNFSEITMGPDQYFLLADNRIEAVDSRIYGPVDKSKIRGKVLFEYLPLNKLRFF